MNYHPSISRQLKNITNILNFNIQNYISGVIDKNKNQHTSILDLGCGVGLSLWELSELFSGPAKESKQELNLHGIFYSQSPDSNSPFYEFQKMHDAAFKNPLMVANEFGIKAEGNVVPKLHNLDACKKLPFADNCIDLIYSTNAFHYFTDKINALSEVHRVLKPNGIAIIAMDRTDNDFWPSNIHFPRLQIRQNSKVINAMEYLESRPGITINEVGDSFILQLRKVELNTNASKDNKTLDFTDLCYNKSKSILLENIRSNAGSVEDSAEYKALLDLGISFNRKPDKKNFGGYLSVYELR